MPLMPVTSLDVSLDEQIERLAAGVVGRIGFDPPDVGEVLRPPALRFARGGSQSIKSYTLAVRGVSTILLGGGLYTAILFFCRAAATFFLTERQTRSRRSAYWPAARAALAGAADWAASPTQEPRFLEFEVSPRQARIADAFAAYTYRFVLCHEMAHVALGHLDDEGRADDELLMLRALQGQELEADGFGLELQLRSLPQRSDLVTALASSIYFLYFTELFDGSRLMLLSDLVDEREWRIEYSHPPVLHRVFHLMGTATGLEGEVAAQGLATVQGSLSEFVGYVRQAATTAAEEVAERAVDALARGARGEEPNPAALAQLIERSPVGMLRAMDVALKECGSDRQRRAATAKVIDQLLSTLPPEFRDFHYQNRAQRSAALA
jgi:hypothetical protein